MNNEVKQKGGYTKNISTWGGQAPSEENNKVLDKNKKSKKPISGWE
jgi:hypothetical protein